MPMDAAQLKYQQDAARKFQRYYDDTLRQVGMRAPQPTLGQDINDYRREMLRLMKKSYLTNHDLYRVNMRGLQDDVLHGFEQMVLPAVVQEANNPLNVPPGELRQINEIDDSGRVKLTRFIGQECFVKDMGRPGRRVASFNTPNGPVSAGGRFLR